MKKQMRLNLVTFCIINAMNINIAEAQTEETLDQINVVEKNVTNDKKPFTEAKAKSTREHIFKDTQTIDQVIRSIPGAFTQQDKGSGVISVNIRGENGLGRVNTMIDGVTQTFYSTVLTSVHPAVILNLVHHLILTLLLVLISIKVTFQVPQV